MQEFQYDKTGHTHTHILSFSHVFQKQQSHTSMGSVCQSSEERRIKVTNGWRVQKEAKGMKWRNYLEEKLQETNQPKDGSSLNWSHFLIVFPRAGAFYWTSIESLTQCENKMHGCICHRMRREYPGMARLSSSPNNTPKTLFQNT